MTSLRPLEANLNWSRRSIELVIVTRTLGIGGVLRKSNGKRKGGETGWPLATRVSTSSDPTQSRTSMIGPFGPKGTSRRGMSSGHHVGDIDHPLGESDLLHQEGCPAEPAVAFPERPGVIREEAVDLAPLYQ